MANNKTTATRETLDEMVAAVDTGARKPTGVTKQLVFTAALAWALFQLWYASPLPYDSYKELRENGGAILIDETSFVTVAACMMQ